MRAVRGWLAQLTFHVAIGNNDAHAKNVALMHLPGRTELSQVYDAVPNLFQGELTKFDLALAVDGVFNHRRLSTERLLAEARAWQLIDPRAARATVEETQRSIQEAVTTVAVPDDASPGVSEQISWNVDRLLAGDEIGVRPR